SIRFMLDEKIDSYIKDIAIARKLAKSEHIDGESYELMAQKLEKMLNFYKTLKMLRTETEF
ncbi:MAG: hypothetical protein ACFFKA_10070, partial [Candidatus Thorarchaeota archaeon]